MVLISIHVRPTSGYHYPNKVDHLSIDSAERLETIQEKYSNKTSSGSSTTTRLYFGDHELPLNSSIGSHNFDDGTILECCRSPAMSAALTACLKDFEQIKKLPLKDRTMENLTKILQTPAYIQNDPDHEIWEHNYWSNDRLKSRTINLAIIKAVLQRQQRYHIHDLPKCNDCQSLFAALQQHNVWTGGNNGGSAFKQQAHIFKPQKKDGNPSANPSANWILMEEKLKIQANIKREFSTSGTTGLQRFTHGYEAPPVDWLEEFVRRDHARHCSMMEQPSGILGCNDDATHLAYLVNSPPRQPTSPARSNGGSSSGNNRRSKNSRSLLSAVEATSLSPTQRASSSYYIPQYASGPFAVLAALHLAMHSKHQLSNGRRLLTLTEDQLKRMAQPLCRSNLYDKTRIRGRNAFACMDGLIEKQLVRKEIVRNAGAAGAGGNGEIEKWGLLRDAEVLGEKCADFDRAVNHVLPLQNINDDTRPLKSNMNIVLCLDTREDAHLLERMKLSCEDEKVPFVEKELPAGDYLFLAQSGLQEYVAPLVVERKSWSDLADSCLGKGRALNRLDCVKLGSSSGCSGNCQLCKMKRCGCNRVMFIIEGERCLASDSVHRTAKKCTKENCCSACRLLSERHDVTQDILEGVLHRLQIEHGCFILYSKSYNETISLLFDMRTLLQMQTEESNHLIFGGERLLFETYASNARRKSSTNVHQIQNLRPTHVKDLNIGTMVTLVSSCEWDLDLLHSLCGENPDLGSCPNNPPSRYNKSDDLVIELNDSEEDSDTFSDMDNATNDCRQMINESVHVDSDSEDEIQLVTEIRGGGETYNLSSDDEVELLSHDGVEAQNGLRNNSQAINIGSDRESEDDPFSSLSRFNKDKRRRVLAKPLDSDDSYSDDSIVLLGQCNKASNKSPQTRQTTIGKRGSTASSVAKRLMYDTDDDSQDEQSHKARDKSACASPSRIRTPSSTKKRKASEMNTEKGKSNYMKHHVYPLLILYGWDDYDRQFHHRIDKLWKKICPYSSEIDQMNDFYTNAVSCLKSCIHESEFTFVRRRTLMRFTLWMQLVNGVQVRSVQRMRFADDIKSYFRQSRIPGVARSLALSLGSSASATPCLGPHSTPVASSTHCTLGREQVCRKAATSTSQGPRSTPVASSTTQRSVDRDEIYQRTVISTNLGPHLTPAPPSTQVTVGRNQGSQSATMPIGRKSTSRDIDSVREARLKRFDKKSIDREQNSRTWSCQECTFENNIEVGSCAMCGCVATVRQPSLSRKVWSCSRCTCQNTIDYSLCSACDAPKTFSSDSASMDVSTHLSATCRPDRPMSSRCWEDPSTSMDTKSKAASKRITRCGACGNEDHTRANATESNCPAYFDDKEVDRREKNRLKREQSLASEQAQIRAIENEAATAEKMQAELARLNEEIKRNNERAEAFRKEELKRRKQKVQRLQKRQNG